MNKQREISIFGAKTQDIRLKNRLFRSTEMPVIKAGTISISLLCRAITV